MKTFAAHHDAQGDPAIPGMGHETAGGDPVGLEATLFELALRNAPADRRTEAPPTFFCNAGHEAAERFDLTQGEPQATPFFSVEQLKAQGVVGLYEPQRESSRHGRQGREGEEISEPLRPLRPLREASSPEAAR